MSTETLREEVFTVHEYHTFSIDEILG